MGSFSVQACRTPPDLAPFSDATSQLASSIKSSGRAVVGEIDAMSRSGAWSPEERERAMAIALRFNDEWTSRNGLANALVDYSSSLTAIAQAGEQGQKSARQVADAFSRLCASIDRVFPAGGTVGAAVDLGSTLYGRFARDNAAKTLGEAMNRLQTAIDATADALSLSLASVEGGLDAIRDQIDDDVEAEELNGVKVSTYRDQARTFTQRRAQLLLDLFKGGQTRDGLRRKLLSPGLSSEDRQAADAELAQVNALVSEISAELAIVETSLAAQLAILQPIDARIAANHERLTAQITLVQSVRAGLADWAAAHGRLASAALERRPVQVNDLIETAAEIKALVHAIRRPTTN